MNKMKMNLHLADAEFSSDFSLIDIFEELNDISVNIFKACPKADDQVAPVRLTKVLKSRHLNLLLVSKTELSEEQQSQFLTDIHFIAIYDPRNFSTRAEEGSGTLTSGLWSFVQQSLYELTTKKLV